MKVLIKHSGAARSFGLSGRRLSSIPRRRGASQVATPLPCILFIGHSSSRTTPAARERIRVTVHPTEFKFTQYLTCWTRCKQGQIMRVQAPTHPVAGQTPGAFSLAHATRAPTTGLLQGPPKPGWYGRPARVSLGRDARSARLCWRLLTHQLPREGLLGLRAGPGSPSGTPPRVSVTGPTLGTIRSGSGRG